MSDMCANQVLWPVRRAVSKYWPGDGACTRRVKRPGYTPHIEAVHVPFKNHVIHGQAHPLGENVMRKCG